jgi:hypothetical protein
MERIEPVELIERIEPVEFTDHSEVDRAGGAGSDSGPGPASSSIRWAR